MKSIIIGIHGLGNKFSRPVFQRWWKTAIKEGLANIGYPDISFDFKLAYYAHYLHPVPEKLHPNDPHHKYADEPYAPSEKPIQPFKPDKAKKRLLDQLEERLDKLFYKDPGLINFDAIADFIIRSMFRDLDTYYHKNCSNPEYADIPAREALRHELASVLRRYRKKRILLISHSMGSIISYDTLTQTAPDVSVHTWVTIGSPLGLPVIVKKILAEQGKNFKKSHRPMTPEGVRHHWYNLSDLDDRITVNYDLKDDYKANKQGIAPEDRIVFNNYRYNGVKNHHKSYGYLRTPEMAHIIHDFLAQDENILMRLIRAALRPLFQKRQERLAGL